MPYQILFMAQLNHKGIFSILCLAIYNEYTKMYGNANVRLQLQLYENFHDHAHYYQLVIN